ncbi:SCO2584 family spore wall biosynthesis protein [Streptomyces phaeoluteigriseus]|uniref:SCO2584 family spore wall biosynthesis protein n=1 Tax=Streptomyces phaeoluteigriseus TaxID=114686 RepID=UPI00368902D6
MPEDVGGTPFPDGWEPDDDHDRGVSDEEFASVVFDEAFIQAAPVHEPTAVERLLAAARARAEASEAEARRARGDRYDDLHGPGDFGHDPDHEDLDDSDDPDDPDTWGRRYGGFGPYGKQVRWHRAVAWMLAVVMGVGMVVLAFAAVYRGASSSGNRDQLPSPASTGLEQGAGPVPSGSTDQSRPPVEAVPRIP